MIHVPQQMSTATRGSLRQSLRTLLTAARGNRQVVLRTTLMSLSFRTTRPLQRDPRRTPRPLKRLHAAQIGEFTTHGRRLRLTVQLQAVVMYLTQVLVLGALPIIPPPGRPDRRRRAAEITHRLNGAPTEESLRLRRRNSLSADDLRLVARG